MNNEVIGYAVVNRNGEWVLRRGNVVQDKLMTLYVAEDWARHVEGSQSNEPLEVFVVEVRKMPKK